MPKWDRPGFKTVNVEVTVDEYEALALIARDGGLPVDEVMKRLLWAGMEAMTQQVGTSVEALAREARRR